MTELQKLEKPLGALKVKIEARKKSLALLLKTAIKRKNSYAAECYDSKLFELEWLLSEIRKIEGAKA